jgi:hypothetical protein
MLTNEISVTYIALICECKQAAHISLRPPGGTGAKGKAQSPLTGMERFVLYPAPGGENVRRHLCQPKKC